MMSNQQCKSSRSGKNFKGSKIIHLPSKLPAPATVSNPFEVSGHAFVDMPTPQRSGKMNKSFKLPVLNPITSSRIPAFSRPTEIRSPILTCRTEWKVPAYNESFKSDSNSQPSFIRSVSGSDSEAWSDDLENEMTAQLTANLTRLDDMFYSSFPATSNSELFQEIKLWQSRFPFLRVTGTKANIISDSKPVDPEAHLEKEEVILNDGKFCDSDDNRWAKITSEAKDRKNTPALKKKIRDAVISNLTNHFLNKFKNEIGEGLQLADEAKVQPKKLSKTTSCANEPLDINDNKLKVSDDFKDILNISPISLKVAAPKSNYLSSFSVKKKESARTKVIANQSTHLRIDHKLSANIIYTVRESPHSTTDDVRVDLMFHESKSSFPARKAPESLSRKHNKKSMKNDELSTPNQPRFGTLPPLKTHGLRPTSAIYNSYNKLPNESRPTSSFILAPSLRLDEASKRDDS